MNKSLAKDLRAEFRSLTPEQRKYLAMFHGFTPEEQHEVLTFARLLKDPAFCAAYDAATPPGERMPPYEVICALIAQWEAAARPSK